MTRQRIFSGSGFAPPKGMHPVVGALIIIYIIFVIYVITTYGVKNVRVTAPGPLLIYAAGRGTQRKEGEPATIYIDKVEEDEICFGYKINNKEKDFFIDEYSYWYYPCKGQKGKTHDYELVFKIKTSRQETIYLLEETNQVSNANHWNMLEEKPESGETTLKVNDLESLAVAVDRYSL